MVDSMLFYGPAERKEAGHSKDLDTLTPGPNRSAG